MTKTFKINPDFTCPELAGYKLPSFPRCHEDDVDAMALDEYEQAVKRKGQEYAGGYYEGIIDGYTKACEKYGFSESQIEKAILFGSMQQHTFGHISRVEEDKFITSLRTPRNPIAIEVEMAKPSESFGAFVGNSIGEFVPALNPDGTVKGRWVYE